MIFFKSNNSIDPRFVAIIKISELPLVHIYVTSLSTYKICMNFLVRTEKTKIKLICSPEGLNITYATAILF